MLEHTGKPWKTFQGAGRLLKAPEHLEWPLKTLKTLRAPSKALAGLERLLESRCRDDKPFSVFKQFFPSVMSYLEDECLAT